MKTYLTVNTVSAFCSSQSQQRKRDLVSFITDTLGTRFNGSNETIFKRILEMGSLEFVFDVLDEPDSDNEINHVDVYFTGKVSGEKSRVYTGYLDVFIKSLPQQNTNESENKMSKVAEKPNN